MLRFLLTMMSIAAQILSGFWSNSALCLRGDGTICCVHDLAGACSCCEHGHDAAQWDDDDLDYGDSVCAIAGSHDHKHPDKTPTEAGIPLESPLTSHEPCGCRHLPLSSGTAPSSQKTTRVTSSDRLQCHQRMPEQASCRWMIPSFAAPGYVAPNSPRCLSVGLMLVASTVIRC